MRVFYILILTILLTPIPQFGQDQIGRDKWNFPFGTEHKASLSHCLIAQNAEGIVAMVGQLKQKGLYFVSIDPENGNEYNPSTLFKECKGMPTAILPYGNGFLVSAISRKNNGHAMLWQVNPTGDKWERINAKFFKRVQVIRDMSSDDNGNLYFTGQKDKRLCFFKLDRVFRRQGPEYIHNGSDESIGTAIDTDGEGNVYVAGHSINKRETRSLLLRFSEQGNFTWNSSEVRKHKVESIKLVLTDQDQIVLAGTTYSGELSREDIKLIVTDKRGKVLNHRTLEHPGDEELTSLTQSPDRHLMVGGASKAPMQSFPNTLLQLIDLQTLDTLDTQSAGLEWEDLTEDILRLNNDDLLVLNSYTTKNARNRKPNLSLYPHSPCEIKLHDDESIHFAMDPIYAHQYIENDLFTFSGTVVSKFPVDEHNIRVKNKGLATKSPGILIFDSLPPYHKDQYCYELSKEFELHGGTNQVTLNIKGTGLLDTLSVFHFPKRPKLHLLSIGIEADDLDYTTHDAKDFAALLKQQEGKLFQTVESTILIDPEETTGSNIRDKILDLKDRYQDNSQAASKIAVEDVLVIFVSSHGLAEEGRFYLRASDYRPGNRGTEVDFQADILDNLATIHCKKLIFIDACKSGKAKGEIDPEEQKLIDQIIEISNMAPGISIMTSCGPSQNSYEAELFENGLFTESIVEGLTNQSFLVDKNADKVISLQELFQYLQVAVPQLAFKMHHDETKMQTPFMPQSDLDESFPIFWLGKKF